MDKDIDVTSALTQWVNLRKQSELLDERIDSLKGILIEKVVSDGFVDDRGHLWLELSSPVAGVKALKWEKRVSTNFDLPRAETILNELGIYDECIKFIPVLDEDAILVAHQEGKISEEQIDEMFPKKETRAFKPEKA